MSDFDFNNAEPQRAIGDLIPDNTICLLVLNVRPGQHGPGGWLKLNRDGTCEMLDIEFTIDGGDFDRRKVWENWVVSGQTDGQQKAGLITRSKLRAVLESAHSINPGDDSEASMAKRQVAGWGGFDSLKICAKIGIETGALKDKTAGPASDRYPDKNRIKAVLTPADANYLAPGPQVGMQTAGAAVQRAAASAGGGTAAAVKSAAKPTWAS